MRCIILLIVLIAAASVPTAEASFWEHIYHAIKRIVPKDTLKEIEKQLGLGLLRRAIPGMALSCAIEAVLACTGHFHNTNDFLKCGEHFFVENKGRCLIM